MIKGDQQLSAYIEAAKTAAADRDRNAAEASSNATAAVDRISELIGAWDVSGLLPGITTEQAQVAVREAALPVVLKVWRAYIGGLGDE